MQLSLGFCIHPCAPTQKKIEHVLLDWCRNWNPPLFHFLSCYNSHPSKMDQTPKFFLIENWWATLGSASPGAWFIERRLSRFCSLWRENHRWETYIGKLEDFYWNIYLQKMNLSHGTWTMWRCTYFVLENDCFFSVASWFTGIQWTDIMHALVFLLFIVHSKRWRGNLDILQSIALYYL